MLFRFTSLCLLAAAFCFAQDAVFRTGVSLVHVDAQAATGGEIIDGLGKQDFEVRDNGRRQTILYCSQEEQPLDVVLLIDVSSSMRVSVARVAASAHAAVAELHPGDRVAVARFNTNSALAIDFTSHLPAVEKTLDRVVELPFGGRTHILSAVYEAAGYFLKQPDGGMRRRAILIVTDNDGQESMKERMVIDRLWAADVVVCGLVVRPPNQPISVGLPGGEDMLGAAEKTGGETIAAGETRAAPGETFRQMLRRIRRRYSLYYAMPAGKPGIPRRVTLTLSRSARLRYPKAQILARKGYVVLAAAAAQ